jgi:AcrR family transcriptional regulator
VSAARIDIRERRRAVVADEIERVAIELFAQRGYTTVTVDDIAEACGISPRTFFRYFPAKADVVRAHQRRLFDRLERALAARPPVEGPVTALRQAFLATTQMRPDDREHVVLVGRLLVQAGELIGRDVGFEADRRGALVSLVAARAGVDPAADPRPAVVVAAMTAGAQAAFRAWLEAGGQGELAASMADALDLLEQGVASFEREGGTGRT